MSAMDHAAVGLRDWNAAGGGNTLIADHGPDTVFVMPGQDDVLHGSAAFCGGLEHLGSALPPGFEIIALRQISDGDEVVSIVDWQSAECAGSRLSVLFRLACERMCEARWFMDSEQWKAAFLKTCGGFFRGLFRGFELSRF